MVASSGHLSRWIQAHRTWGRLVGSTGRTTWPAVLLWWCVPLLGNLGTYASADGVEPDRHPVIAGYERFYATQPPGSAAGGRLLLGELNCISCHEAGGAAAHLLPKQAPILDHVGQRVRPAYLRAFLANPHAVKPGTTMPNLFAGVEETERERQIDALVHLLASTGRIRESAPVTAAARRGEALFHTVGCVACHNERRTDADLLATSVPLPPVMEAKYSVPGLAAFLTNPLEARPGGRMPHLNLSTEEARDLACYLLQDLDVEGSLTFSYYEGNWQTLPNFARLTPKIRGQASSFDVNVNAKDHFGLVFDGLFRVSRDGRYRFHLGSDDGARLSINGQPLIDVDGIHPLSFKAGEVELSAGVHQVHVEYFEQGGEQELRVEFEGPELKRQSLEFALVTSREEGPDDDRLNVDAGKVAEGKRLFSRLGCAACHQLQPPGTDAPLAVQQQSPPRRARSLAELIPLVDRQPSGCLSPTGSAGRPHYGLTSQQSNSVSAALQAIGSLSPPANEARIDHTLTAFNCRACHARDKQGGVEAARNAAFKSNQPEMGDEGRIPPALDGVGAKLRSDWLRHVFSNGAKDRPYMLTRMPRFGAANVGHLVPAFEAVDATDPAPAVSTDIPVRRLKAAGRRLVGAQGFSCIKCHTWGNMKATGIQSIGMTTMTRRLKPSWFVPYVLDPQSYRPGTRMPAAWPMGQVLLPKLLDGKAETQIHAVWEYLSDGDQAPMPTGLGGDPIVLRPVDEPILYRNFIAGAGPRAIGVGYPEGVNLAFDANNLRLAVIWHNAFMDAAKHWRGRGPGFQTPLGDNVLNLHDGAPLALLATPDAGWPQETARQSGHRFLGYDLDEHRRPTFRYRWNDVLVEDDFEPTSDEEFTPLRRTLTFTAPQPIDHAWWRAVTASSIEPLGNGTYRVDDQWTVKLNTSAGTPRLRQADGNMELLVPILANAVRQTVTQEFIW